jgi:hypothetical protein
MKTSTGLTSLLLLVASLSITHAQNNFSLNSLWEIQADAAAYLTYGTGGTNGYNQRGLAADPVSGNLVFAEPKGGQNGSTNVLGSIYILNKNSGNVIATLNTNGITAGGGSSPGYAFYAAAVADDGVVYLCDEITSSTNVLTPFKIYRWDSVSSVNPPSVAFSGVISPARRYGVTLDIRGSSSGTEIIIGSLGGTNIVLFNTADGLTFTPNVIACTNVPAGSLDHGIAFGTNNTFWAKGVGSPLFYMSYDLANKKAGALFTYNNTNLSGYLSLGPLAVERTNRNLLAAMEVTGGPERIWLFDITNPTQPPSLLSIKSVTPNNANATAPAGYLSFGGGSLFAHVLNNALIAFSVDSQSTPFPVIERDLPGTNRVAVGQTAHFEVLADPAITGYQWRTNGVDIPGATKYYLDVPNAQLSDSGRVYTVRVSNAAGFTDSASSLLSVVSAADVAHLDLLWAAAPDTTNYMSNGGSTTPNERCIAYSTLANELYLVRRAAAFITVYVIDPITGAVLRTLKTDGISGGTIPLNAIAAAGDGAIYACNIQDNSSNLFRIYRWANSDATTVPVKIFEGNPVPNLTATFLRWGDNLDARGSGAETQIIIDDTDASQSLRYASVLTPQPSDLTLPWTPHDYSYQYQDGSALSGRSLQFGAGNTFWQKRMPAAGNGTPFVQSSFDLSNPGSVAATNQSTSATVGQPITTNGPAAIDITGSNLGATINFITGFGSAGTIPATLDLYDLTVAATPVLLNRYNFPVNQVPNGNPCAQILFTTNSDIGKNMVFALNGNNGLLVYTFAFGPVSKPRFLLQPQNTRIIKGGTNSLAVVNDQTVPVQWRKDGVDIINATNTSLVVPGQFTNAGNYVCVATNSTGATTSQVASVSIAIADDNYTLALNWSKTAGATVGGANYLSSGTATSTPNERGFGYDATTTPAHLIVVQKQGSTAAYQVKVVDATTGTYLYDLSTTGINASPGSEVAGANAIGLVDAAAADDGVVFACNETPNASGGSNGVPSKMFQIYRWPDSVNTALAPATVWLGDPSGQGTTNNIRWGDQMSVRGSSSGTELIFDSNDGARAAILRTNSLTGGFSNVFPVVTVSFNGSIGRNTQFATGTNFNNGTNFWQKRKGEPLQLTTYNTNNGTSAFAVFGNFPSTLGALAVDSNRKLGIGIDYTSITVARVVLYDLSNPNSPMLISITPFPAAPQGNGNFIGKIILSGNRVFALNANNGMMAFTLQDPTGRPSLTVNQAGPNAVLSWGTNHVGWTLQSTPTLAPTAWANVTPAPVIVGQNYFVTNAMSSAAFYRLAQ